jgi:hypothetical protein
MSCGNRKVFKLLPDRQIKHNRPARTRLLFAGVSFVFIFLVMNVYGHWGTLSPGSILTIENFADISGLAYLPNTRTLLAVGDDGLIGEVDMKGNILSRRSYSEYDFESVIVLPERDDQVLVIDEKGSRLVWFSVPGLNIVHEQDLPDEARIGTTLNKQIEGIALFKKDEFVLANEGPATLLFLNRNLNELIRSVSLGTHYISGLVPLYDDSLLVISRDAGLRMYSATGEPLGPWRQVREGFIECGVFVPDHGLVLCVDRDPSKLLFFPEFRNDISLKEFFTGSSEWGEFGMDTN